MIKRIEDLDADNIYDPDPKQHDRQFFPDPSQDNNRGPSGLYRCPYCDRLQPTWGEHLLHIKDHEMSDATGDGGEDGFPDTQMGDAQDSIPTRHFEEQQPFTFPVASVAEARRVDGFKTLARAFRFDDDQHRHYIACSQGVATGFATLDSRARLCGFRVNRPVSRALWERVLRDYGEITVFSSNF